MTAPLVPQRVGIAVCTLNRPRMLADCLAALNALIVPAGWQAVIHVVENSAEPLSRPVVAAATGPLAVHYHQEPQPGIPQARNRALAACLADGCTWIAMIDDDEQARPDWLARLIAAVTSHQAEVASGLVVPRLAAPPPPWWTPPRIKDNPDGARLDAAATNNVLFAARLAAADGLALRFDPRLTLGGEDVDFFGRAHQAGVRIVWAPQAVVDETVPPARLSLKRVLQRSTAQAAALVVILTLRHGRGAAWRRYGVKSLSRISRSALIVLLALLLWPLARRAGGRLLYRALNRLANGWGLLLGLLARSPAYYHQIDGD